MDAAEEATPSRSSLPPAVPDSPVAHAPTPTKLYIHFNSVSPIHEELHGYFAQFFDKGKGPTVRMSHDHASAFLNAHGNHAAVRTILDTAHPGMVVKIDRAALARGRRIFVKIDKDLEAIKSAVHQKNALDDLRSYFERFGTVVLFEFENLRNNALLEMSCAEETDAVLTCGNHYPWLRVAPDAIRRAISAGGSSPPIEALNAAPPNGSVVPNGTVINGVSDGAIAAPRRPTFAADDIAELLALRRKYVDTLMQLDNRIREVYANSHFFRGGFPDDFNPNYA